MPESLEEKRLEDQSTESNKANTPQQSTNTDEIKALFVSMLEELKTEIKTDVQKGLNSLDKKINKIKPVGESPAPANEGEEDEPNEPVVNKPVKKDKATQTIEVLKSEYEQKQLELEARLNAEIEKLRNEQQEKEQAVFQATVRSKLISQLTKSGFEDPEETLDVFLHKHPINNFITGVEGIYLYKKSEDDQGKTLEKLVSDWKETKTGKRYLAADKLPNGAGLQETTKPTKVQDTAPLTKTQDIVQRYQNNQLEFAQFK